MISSVAHGRVFRSRMIVRSGLLASAAPANHVRELIDDDDDVMSVIDEVTEPCAALLYHLGTSASPIRLDMCPNGRNTRSLSATQSRLRSGCFFFSLSRPRYGYDGAFGVAIYIEPFLGLVRQKNNNLSLVVMPRGLMILKFVNYGAMDA